MASPYRDARRGATPEPTDDGIVDDLVRQFADPYAFFRELVQNGIDAGASALHAQVLFEDDGSFQASLRDDGVGMTREVVENELLVLFKSGKEGREDAIGKFGIGFISVFALEPVRVVVRTSRGEGTRLTLHLHPDHTFELFESAGGSRAGTSVTLEVGPGRASGEVAAQAEASLRRWCRHARIPIHLRIAGGGLTEREVRIDAPLGLEGMHAAVKVRSGKTRVVLGLPKRREDRYAGFFNAGLMLHESHEGAGAFRGLAFKVQDPRLEHTLSRDDVRRDAAYRSVLSVVQRGITRLRESLLTSLEAAAKADEAAPYAALVARVLDEASALRLALEDVPLVLLAARHGERPSRPLSPARGGPCSTRSGTTPACSTRSSSATASYRRSRAASPSRPQRPRSLTTTSSSRSSSSGWSTPGATHVGRASPRCSAPTASASRGGSRPTRAWSPGISRTPSDSCVVHRSC